MNMKWFFMCVLSIELIWVEIYGKREEKHNFWAFPRSSIGTKQSGTGTISVLVNWYWYRKVGTGTPMFYFGPTLVFWP